MVTDSTMVKKPKRSSLAQSRIDYIVFGNPNAVGKLVYDYGFVPPKSLEDLSEVVHELIRSKGKKIVVDLVRLHPDMDAILNVIKSTEVANGPKIEKKPDQKAPDNVIEASGPATENKFNQQASACSTCGKSHKEDNYCGCSHSYLSYDEPSSAKENFSDLGLNELMARYEVVSKQSLNNPENKSIADEATRLWNEIRKRNKSEKEKSSEAKPPIFSISKMEVFIVVSLTVVAGLLIGWSLGCTRAIKSMA